MSQSRDFVSIRGVGVRHTTAVRDWVCGECGSRLRTVFAAEGWATICSGNPAHEVDKFVHKTTWAYLEHRRFMEAATAADVFDHLPAELQATITERG